MDITKSSIEYLKNKKVFLFNCESKKISFHEFEFNFLLASITRIYEEFNFLKENNKSLIDGDVIVDNSFENLYFKANFFKNKVIASCTYGNFEFQTIKINEIYDYICNIINKCYSLSFDIRIIDPIYFSLFLWKRINKVKYAHIDYIYLDSLYLPLGKYYKQKLEETDVYKTLIYGKKCCIDSIYNSNHIQESSYDRTIKILESIKKNGYPYNNRYIILYNNENIIRDGQHRACGLKYIYGNIKIPVMRIYFNN